MKEYYVYIMTNNSKSLYTGVTDNLIRRLEEHKTGKLKSFTSKYNIKKLVYFEMGGNINEAIYREKQIKGWVRLKKIALIEEVNPGWKDLSKGWFD